ncbi:hypothetical protein VCHA36P166_110002 [Vibrio chagasii]|nr:hypothetical protein VCHA36P166_110002 [Vibrio chagasii]
MEPRQQALANQVSEFSKQYQVITVVALAEDVKSAISSDR